ncbi:MAG: tRNA (adenosine(37)-N6)-threonylcarbamoyltransferase complex transferase subunit TsaD [Campylobacter sp.]|nr:tRNA (adenosine(37)-N6)-threonylcarbamoyltransferase complex transferase subunit TsaD [Campylobacter sp.]
MILGIESSCDDSSVALIDANTFECKFYKKISQELDHAKFGGVVPELAARLHTAAFPNLLKEIEPFFGSIKAVCVTNEPGLSVSLITGVSMAKSISVALDIPLIAINHLIGHIYSLFLNSPAKFPLGVLLVSGGHTMVLDVKNKDEIRVIAQTSDDSFGESFDKVAKMLNLPYPGGVQIQSKAKFGDENRYKFTTPLLHSNRLEYSFSGLKNQVRLAIEELDPISENEICDICASFEKTACLHILDKLSKIFKTHKFENFGVVGGASANLRLRKGIVDLCQKHSITPLFAPLEFCSDNALMIARMGVDKFKDREFTPLNEMKINPKVNFANAF